MDATMAGEQDAPMDAPPDDTDALAAPYTEDAARDDVPRLQEASDVEGCATGRDVAAPGCGCCPAIPDDVLLRDAPDRCRRVDRGGWHCCPEDWD